MDRSALRLFSERGTLDIRLSSKKLKKKIYIYIKTRILLVIFFLQIQNDSYFVATIFAAGVGAHTHTHSQAN